MKYTVYEMSSNSQIDQLKSPSFRAVASFEQADEASTYAISRASALGKEMRTVVVDGTIRDSFRGEK